MTLAILGVATANAQFTKGTKRIAAQTSAFDLNFGSHVTNFNIGAKGSYFIINNLAVKAGIGFDYRKEKKSDTNTFNFEVGADYYFYKIFYGGFGFSFDKPKSIDLQSAIKLEAGASYYIAQNVYVNPAIYYKSGLGDNKVSRFGLEMGIGVNF